ncbi:A/G-specific adenine glycosylase [Luteibacter sp. UNCMF366Tsu5.1]|uniref:A/G-specific adenine glycosylase n=1 Tax=Luteibacter sp. UNCMF366Tsu5.1 TaxID=1502758 RepID=UPI0009088B03|nr:A/G-specific adenine glycosylase [Luteibacter sp. UNCMF366Tsu5.1]SFW37914.1 A/G-specific DNA-adenine glycosylase [Luteibacter sp. UNCMF366Tsu5.1]
MNRFAEELLRWFDHHGRKDLPWQHPRDAYRVWLSEIMLQQTQVITVIGYFQRFVERLPTLASLAAADEDTVLALWSGLGYYRRARFLHRAAQLCVERHDGELPRDLDALMALPGIGRSTAGAILAQAYGLRFPILDGNVKRVLTRYHGIAGFPGESAIEKRLWIHADEHTPAERTADYTQAIMDLGATVCVRSKPACLICPQAATCVAHRDGLTAVLPTAKPGKKIPTRSLAMLLLRDAQGRVLLEKRGPQGVWSGLWSLPEAADIEAAGGVACRLARVRNADPLPAFTHVFSHYRLDVSPILFDHATPLTAVADGESRRWCDLTQIASLGLPAPVRTLLDNLPEITP